MAASRPDIGSEPLSSVVFEIINEPHEDDNVVEIIEGALSEIRSITGNESRQVIVSGEGFSTRVYKCTRP